MNGLVSGFKVIEPGVVRLFNSFHDSLSYSLTLLLFQRSATPARFIDAVAPCAEDWFRSRSVSLVRFYVVSAGYVHIGTLVFTETVQTSSISR